MDGQSHSGKVGFAPSDFTVAVWSRNFIGTESTGTYTPEDIYVDSYNTKANRRNAGKTQYPAYGTNATTQYGGSAFNMATVLGTTDFFELMQFGNKIRWPNKDFSWVNHPTQDQADADINYDSNIAASSGTNIGGSYYRWFCKKFSNALTGSSGFTINIEDGTLDAKIYAIVHSTGDAELTTWLDCDTSPGFQPGDPNPGTVADGDLCLLEASSDDDTKVCTFGTATYTGHLYVRIGLKDTADNFTDITITGT